MKNYIWDFDGTLFDTYPAMVDGAWQALKDFGISMDKNHRLTESTWGLLKEHRLAHLIEEVVGIDQDFPRKPDPASLNYLIDTFHLERTDTMMIGDRRLDIEAGKNAGVATCLYDIDHFLGEIPADYVVGNLNEILTLQSIIKK
ncbi:hypothetical protein B1P88_08115 [Enterococcus faecium]|nr:hypothetical protein B1P88_08115 [Enterococcus faecium]